MVMTTNGNGNKQSSDIEVDDTVSTEAKHWLKRTPVGLQNIQLCPEALDGEYVHTSALLDRYRNGEKRTTGGNQTIIDRDYVCYRIGTLLVDCGFSTEDVTNGELSDKLADLITDSLEYYPRKYYQAKLDKDKVVAATVSPMRQLLIASGREDAINWSDEKVAEFIQSMLK